MVTGASGASQVPPKIQRKKQRVGSPRPGIKHPQQQRSNLQRLNNQQQLQQQHVNLNKVQENRRLRSG